MSPYETPDDEEVDRINRLQREMFDELYHLFDPPLPEGVPERLERIVASAEIARGDNVLDVGSGTGILVPLIQKYGPARLFACDLSEAMLKQLKRHYPNVEAIVSDIRELALPDLFLDVIFINACYPNIVDKGGAFTNLGRMTRPAGRMVISHPLGKAFIDSLKRKVPFPLDEFPEKSEAEILFEPFGFSISEFVDETELYILVATKQS
ncbi:MAG: methyltransferase domain-containing protein [Desulfobacteraceae bacterium]|jgi:ubiquinone/menaquinone biosynthesis C-methylase UbiE